MRGRRGMGGLAAVVVAAALLMQGCSPSVLCVIETEVYPDYTCTRLTRMDARPNPQYPGQRTRLTEYFQFPPAELYDSYAVQSDKALFAGNFDSFEQIPSDLVRPTPGTTALAGNLRSFRVMDMVLFVWADFDETITDIIQSQEDGESALQELVRLVVPEVMAVLNAKYGQRFDLRQLESWLYNDFPAKLRRLYAGAWAIHSAKRSGVTSPGEDFEFYMFLKAEAAREGLELAEPNHPDLEKENVRRLKEYGMRLAARLAPPRAGTGGVSAETFAGTAMDELLAGLQQAIIARHGSINNFIAKIAALVPRAFGAYMTGTTMPLYMLPNTTYQYRLRVPGTVIQTNGVRELNGDLVWNFADRDLAFTGQSLWARSLFVREPAVYALGLRGFPASLGDVDKVFGLCLTPQGSPREELLRRLRDSVSTRSLAPLQAMANDQSSPDAPSARGLLELFEQHRRNGPTRSAQPGQTSQDQPAAQPPTAPPPLGVEPAPAPLSTPPAAPTPTPAPAPAAPAVPGLTPITTPQAPPLPG
ncbi:MAG: hypothetical protein LUC93_10880 [Planctomycetaceae bacterium]|nr:hypothetical protein [Planctomycetaceae bacterium]